MNGVRRSWIVKSTPRQQVINETRHQSNLSAVLQTGRDAIVISCQLLKLFKKDEGENSVWSKTEIVRCKSFPQ